jgi:hypothetical protein
MPVRIVLTFWSFPQSNKCDVLLFTKMPYRRDRSGSTRYLWYSLGIPPSRNRCLIWRTAQKSRTLHGTEVRHSCLFWCRGDAMRTHC